MEKMEEYIEKRLNDDYILGFTVERMFEEPR